MATFKLPNIEPETFDFEGKDGKTYSVPLVRHLPFDVMREHTKLFMETSPGDRANMEAEFAAQMFDKYAPGSLEGLTMQEFSQLFGAWYAAGRVSMGESKPSSD